jgi:peptidoglycan hydrolase-like protein with peptidoglycan-binding domain
VVGAGLGFAATFINPVANLLTSFVPAGWMVKAAAAGIGAVVGAGGALVMHLIGQHQQNLAMQAQTQATQQDQMVPTPMPAGGTTLRAGARGPAAKKLQADLHTLGLYTGKLDGSFNKGTIAAVRKYEVMKGVVPTGAGSADLRAAVSQDAALVKQYA